MKRKLICCFHFCFVFIFCYLGCFFLHHLQKLFPFSFASSPLCLLLKKQAPFQKKMSLSVLLFYNKRQLKKQKTTSKPAPFFSLMAWTVVDFDNNLCLVLVPYLSFAFPKHGLHIREYTDTHSPEATARIHDDAAASQCLRSASCIPPVAAFSTNGLLQISVKML